MAISIKSKIIQEPVFDKLLFNSREAVLSELSHDKHVDRLSGNDFEAIVFEHAKRCAMGTEFENKIEHTPDRDFPDIVAADYYGIEVKATRKDDWRSIGNSVLESSRVKSIEKIYVFFGKLGGLPDIKYRKYDECLKGIAVTHYPRYQIDMELDQGDSIFDKMQVPYDALRNSQNPISHIRRYYATKKSPGDSLWWIDDNVEREFDPIIKSLSSLQIGERDEIIADIFVNCPEIFSNSNKKYEGALSFMVSKYGIISTNIRDSFSAGGKVEIRIDNETVLVPQIVKRMMDIAHTIHAIVPHEESWLREIDTFSNVQELSGHRLSDFYRMALK